MQNGLTLRQGLSNFRTSYVDHLSHEKEGLTDSAKAFFDSHDIAHVLFGCDISLYGEGLVKIWTIFGTNLGFWKHLKGYRAADAYSLSKAFVVSDYVKHLFRLLYSIPKAIYRARSMSKLWDWSEFDQYLDVPIADIRSEFNIEIIQ